MDHGPGTMDLSPDRPKPGHRTRTADPAALALALQTPYRLPTTDRRPEVRGRRSEVGARGPESGVRSPGSGGQRTDHGPWTWDHGPKTGDQRSEVGKQVPRTTSETRNSERRNCGMSNRATAESITPPGTYLRNRSSCGYLAAAKCAYNGVRSDSMCEALWSRSAEARSPCVSASVDSALVGTESHEPTPKNQIRNPERITQNSERRTPSAEC